MKTNKPESKETTETTERESSASSSVVRSQAHCNIITKHQITNEYVSINKLHIAQILYGDGWVSLMMPKWLHDTSIKCDNAEQAKDILYGLFEKWAQKIGILCA